MTGGLKESINSKSSEENNEENYDAFHCHCVNAGR
jgi:hypothetical protein